MVYCKVIYVYGCISSKGTTEFVVTTTVCMYVLLTIFIAFFSLSFSRGCVVQSCEALLLLSQNEMAIKKKKTYHT